MIQCFIIVEALLFVYVSLSVFFELGICFSIINIKDCMKFCSRIVKS